MPIVRWKGWQVDSADIEAVSDDIIKQHLHDAYSDGGDDHVDETAPAPIEGDAREVEEAPAPIEGDAGEVGEAPAPIEVDGEDVEEAPAPIEDGDVEEAPALIEGDHEVEEAPAPIEGDHDEVEQTPAPIEGDHDEVAAEEAPAPIEGDDDEVEEEAPAQIEGDVKGEAPAPIREGPSSDRGSFFSDSEPTIGSNEEGEESCGGAAAASSAAASSSAASSSGITMPFVAELMGQRERHKMKKAKKEMKTEADNVLTVIPPSLAKADAAAGVEPTTVPKAKAVAKGKAVATAVAIKPVAVPKGKAAAKGKAVATAGVIKPAVPKGKAVAKGKAVSTAGVKPVAVPQAKAVPKGKAVPKPGASGSKRKASAAPSASKKKAKAQDPNQEEDEEEEAGGACEEVDVQAAGEEPSAGVEDAGGEDGAVIELTKPQNGWEEVSDFLTAGIQTLNDHQGIPFQLQYRSRASEGYHTIAYRNKPFHLEGGYSAWAQLIQVSNKEWSEQQLEHFKMDRRGMSLYVLNMIYYYVVQKSTYCKATAKSIRKYVLASEISVG
ncbi:unnamed protein product, partial [Prorocentrum cordatum]